MKLFDSLTIILALIIGSVLITFLHEIGHALTASLLTKKKSDIYIGSYGDDDKNIRFSIWLLNFNINYKFWQHYGGLCVTKNDNISINQQILYTIAGPLFPLVVIATFVWSTQILDINEYIVANSYVVLILSIISMIYNLIPKDDSEVVYNGKIIHNDGYQLKELFKYKKLSKEYIIAIETMNNSDFKNSERLFFNLISKGLSDINIHRLYIYSLIQLNQYEKVIGLFKDFFLQYEADSNDYCNAGISYSKLGLNTEALDCYKNSLKLDPTNKYALNNLGYALNLIGEYEKAISLFDNSIELDSEFAYSYNNRGLAKIKTGRIVEGLKDMNKSFEIDPTNSYYFKNMGIYHFDNNEYQTALDLFEKAKELDSTTYKINEDIETVKIKLQVST